MPSDLETPVPTLIPLFEPEIAGNEWRYVKECLDTGWVSSVGSYVDRFEAAMAARVGCAHGVATASGTAALHTALLVAGVEAGDEVIVSNLTFVAPANAIRYCGAFPVFVEPERTFWQMDPQRLADFLERDCAWGGGVLRNRRTGRRVRGIVPVHVLGHPCDLEPILALAGRFDLPVIEDASESLGARYRGRPVGGLGSIGCFSFNGSKIVTSGGGGMLTTDNDSWAERARYLTTQAKDDPIEYVHENIGYNYRLTNVAAAIGLAQLEQLDGFIAKKRAIAAVYERAIAGCPGIGAHPAAPWADPTYWLYTITVDETVAGYDSRALLRQFAAAGVMTRPLWHPMAGLTPFRDCELVGNGAAHELYRRALSLPSSTTLSAEQQARVIAVLQQSAGPSR
jgi:perosamine synthetase